MTPTTIAQGLSNVVAALASAREALADDGSASPVTAAVVEEFARKADKAVAAGDRDAVIEVEQAGDSAKAAAEADPGIGGEARQLVLDAHLAICMLKAETAGSPSA